MMSFLDILLSVALILSATLLWLAINYRHGDTHTEREPARLALWQVMVNDLTLEEMQRQLSRVSKWAIAAAFCAWGLSSFFLVKYMSGGEMNLATWTLEQWGNAGFALLLTAIITAFQFFLYSINQKGMAGVIGVAVCVFFGLFSEISNSMEREGETVRKRSEDSSVFQATVAAISEPSTQQAVSASPALIRAESAKAKALIEIEACDRHQPKGQARVDRCLRIERGNLAAAEASIQAIKQSQVAALAASQSQALAMVDKAKALSFDENQHFEVIKLLKEWLGIAAIFASFLFSFIIMGTFEYAFHYLAVYSANLKKAVKWEMAYQAGDHETTTQSPVTMPKEPEPAAPKAGAVMAESEPMPFGFAPRKKVEDKPVAEQPNKQKLGRTGRANPVLGKAEYQYSIRLGKPCHTAPETRVTEAEEQPAVSRVTPCTVHGEPVTQQAATEEGDGIHHDPYHALKMKLVNREFSPTFRPLKIFLKSENIGGTDRERQAIASTFLDRLFAEGVLILNPANTGEGIKKATYIINPEYQA